MVVSGLPVDGHLHGDVDPREAARAGMRCIEHLGPGVTVFAAAGTCEQGIRASPPRTIRLPSLRLPGMDRLLEAVLRRIVLNPAVTATPEDARQLGIGDATFDDERAHQLAELVVEQGTWHCPTLIRAHTQKFPDAPEHAADPASGSSHPTRSRAGGRARAGSRSSRHAAARRSAPTGRPSSV